MIARCILSALTLLLGGGAIGCTTISAYLGVPTAPIVPPPGAIFTSYKAPLDFATPTDGISESRELKVGSTSSHFIRLISPDLTVAAGSAAIETAARNGNISTVHYADYEYVNVLFLYTQTKVNVYGE